MLDISDDEIKRRMALDNPWWAGRRDPEALLPRRQPYFDQLHRHVAESAVRRAVVLMGPRRVGKTVLLKQLSAEIVARRTARAVLYVSVDQPLYSGIALEKLLNLFDEIHGHSRDATRFVFFDEVQYLTGWEIHLKSLVDTFPQVRFVVSGSSAAALRMQSVESGAGRFTDYLLPPLSFLEFVDFRNIDGFSSSIDYLNEQFLHYLNFGGFPEAVANPEIQAVMPQYIGNDIVDKVLLRDLPSLYGIADTRELNKFFQTIAYNSGQELSIEAIERRTEITKPTIRRYLEYLEAAFLIKRLYRVDQNARRLRRETTFKVYLTNASLRAALFGPLANDDPAIGSIVETSTMAQHMHMAAYRQLRYARWRGGEIDWVFLDPGTQKPSDIREIKWSDRSPHNTRDLKTLVQFAKRHGNSRALVTTKTFFGQIDIGGVAIYFRPTAWFCLRTGVVWRGGESALAGQLALPSIADVAQEHA